MRLSRLGHAVNWKYALGEFILIVVGILVALGFDSWNRQRLGRRFETQMLRELDASLAGDAQAVRDFIDLHGGAQQSARVLLAYADRRLPYADSLDAHFGWMLAGTFFVPNTAAYETLKSRGMETISNDSLRMMVARLYDDTYERMERLDHLNVRQFENLTQPYLMGRFRNVQLLPDPRATPFDGDALLRDPQFRGALQAGQLVRGFTIPQFEVTGQQIQAVRGAIARELARRK